MKLEGSFRSGGFSMTNVRRQSRQMWISRNIDSMPFVVFCPLQLGQVSGVPQVSSVTDNSSTRGTGRFFPLGFLDDEGLVAIAANVDLSQERFHGFDGVLRMTLRAR
jgi:hypothetical protein